MVRSTDAICTISLFINYRHLNAANIAPCYEFGFSLTFEDSKLSITPVGGERDQDGAL